MALLWVDGFEKFGTVNAAVSPSDIVNSKYLGVKATTADVVPGASGGKALRIDNTSTWVVTPVLGTGNDTLIIGFAYKVNSIINDNLIVEFRTPSAYGSTIGYNELSLRMYSGNTGNEIRLYKWTYDLLDTSNGIDIQPNTWYYLEVKVEAATVNGSLILKVDGNEAMNYTGNTVTRTEYPFYSRVSWRDNKNAGFQIDDLYICDATGNTNNDFLGTCNVKTVSPAADISCNWTLSTGNDAYALIDEDDLDSNYLTANTSGQIALVETENVAISGTIVGAMVCCDLALDEVDAQLNKYARMITQNGASGSPVELRVPVPGTDNSVVCSTQIMETDTDGNAWTNASVNALRIGVEVA